MAANRAGARPALQGTNAIAASIDDYHWLLSSAAAPTLDEATSAAADKRPSLALIAGLRKLLSPERAHLVAEQAELRSRAGAKFRDAAKMFFTPRALEQATDQWLAAYKAKRFRAGASVVDFCSGIGGDLVGLAARGPTLGVDRNALMTLLANANLAALGLSPPGDARAAEVSPAELREADAWHIDPDRRPGGHRTSRPEFADPGLTTLDSLRAICPHAAIKMAPAAEPPDAWQAEAELEWISRQGECRQLIAWFGDLTTAPGRRRATVLKVNGLKANGLKGHADPLIAGTSVPPDSLAAAGGNRDSGSTLLVRSVVGDGDEPLPIAGEIGAYLFEPDAAVLAAGLQGALAAEHRLAAIAPGVAYWTGDELLVDPALAAFKVLVVLPFNLRRVKAVLSERQIGRVEVKQRGAGLDPAQIDRQLRGPGDEHATLLLARTGKRILAIVGRRQ